MLLYLCSDLDDEELPHRTRLTELITDRFKLKMTALMDELKVRSLFGVLRYQTELFWKRMQQAVSPSRPTLGPT